MASIRNELREYGLFPRKRLGQHFLVDPNILNKVIRTAQVGKEDVVLEVGPGLGAMTLALAREVKKVIAIEIDRKLVAILKEKVIGHYSGLTVTQMQSLRKQMRQAGARVKVAKNRLAKIALKDTDAAVIAPLLKGPTVLAYSGDPVAAPKVAVDFAKANEAFVILGGSMGKTARDLNGVKALASLPSLDELRGKIVGLLVSPATKIAQYVNAPAAKVARVVQAYASKSAAA